MNSLCSPSVSRERVRLRLYVTLLCLPIGDHWNRLLIGISHAIADSRDTLWPDLLTSADDRVVCHRVATTTKPVRRHSGGRFEVQELG